MRKLNPTTDRVNSIKARGHAVIGLLVACVIFPLFVSTVAAGLYVTSSAHGDATSGVQRSSMTGYNAGNCDHCHEQHATLGGVEPTPQGGTPSQYILFYDNNVGQTDNICFQCHDNTTSISQRAIINRSYSYRAGGWSGDTVSSISTAFGFTSAHTLVDIVSHVTGSWGYTGDSNPCAACHNPHAAQGDPFNAPNSAKSSAARGSVVSLPTLHSRDNNSWGLWGDAANELMNNYTASYQAPYYYYSATPSVYEPAGDTTWDGSNLTDFVTFCTDCHGSAVSSSDAIYITPLNGGPVGTVAAIDWSGGTGDKHGQVNGDVGVDIRLPYTGTGYVLSCVDCHEPHGSPNNYLIRQEVNGQQLNGTVAAGAADFGFLCQECHTDDVAAAHNTNGNGGVPLANGWEWVHHYSADRPYDPASCLTCHSASNQPILCSNCHFHGGNDNWAPVADRTGLKTF